MLDRFRKTLHTAGIDIEQDTAMSRLLTDIQKKKTAKAEAIAAATIFNPEWVTRQNEQMVEMAHAYGLPEKAQEMARQAMIGHAVQITAPERTVFVPEQRAWLDSYKIFIPHRNAFNQLDIARYPQLTFNAAEAASAMRGFVLELSRTSLDPADKFPLRLSAYVWEPVTYPAGYPDNEQPTHGLLYERHTFNLHGTKDFPDHDDGYMDKRIRDVDFLLTDITKVMRDDVYRDSLSDPSSWLPQQGPAEESDDLTDDLADLSLD